MNFKKPYTTSVTFLPKVTPDGIVTRCSMSCPYKWVGDGRCQLPCNTTSCEHDGGDCIKQQVVGTQYAEDQLGLQFISREGNLLIYSRTGGTFKIGLLKLKINAKTKKKPKKKTKNKFQTKKNILAVKFQNKKLS